MSAAWTHLYISAYLMGGLLSSIRGSHAGLGGNGLETVIAAMILAAAAVYAINIWSTTKKEIPPAKNLERGIVQIKDAAGKAIEPRN